MSLHVTNTEAENLIHQQRRNAFIASTTIAVLSITLLLLLLSLYLLQPLENTSDITPIDVVRLEPDLTEIQGPRPKQRPNTLPIPAINPIPQDILSTPLSAPIAMFDSDSEMPTMEFDSAYRFDEGFETSTLSGKGLQSPDLPVILKGRCSQAERIKRLHQNGGSTNSEKAVTKALTWLKSTQNDDGSWGDQHQVAMTGFAILSYLGHCETPGSAQYGDTVSRGLTYLIDAGMKSDGKLWVSDGIPAVYEHGIATYALAEAYTFTKGTSSEIPNLKNVLRKAGNRIIDGQAPCGGWAYHYNTRANEGDNSVGFWQIQALKACKHTGIWPEAKFTKTITNAVKWLEQVQGPNGAIGYRGSHTKSPGLTGGGVLAFQIWDQGDSHAANKGITYIRQNTQFKWGTASSNLYYHYYNAQAMMNAGGSDWQHYNQLVMGELVNHQNDDGSWTQKMGHGPVNDHMATCLATMTLEVYYRFLPGSTTKHQ